MSAFTFHSRVAWSLVAAFVWLGFYAGRAKSEVPHTYALHIERQPLDTALQELAKQTGMQIVFFSHLTDGRSAPSLIGTYTVESAMAALLAEAGLTFRVIQGKTIEISAPRTRPPGETLH